MSSDEMTSKKDEKMESWLAKRNLEETRNKKTTNSGTKARGSQNGKRLENWQRRILTKQETRKQQKAA